MKTTIIAAARGYSVEQIRPWAESLRSSGYTSGAVVILYEKNDEMAEYLGGLGIYGFYSEPKSLTHVATQRFCDYAELLQTDYFKDVEYVIHTDIRDVIFQTNPETWLLNNLGESQLMATSEGVTYRHEDWNGEGLEYNFGAKAFAKMADQETLCSGIIAGRKEALVHLFKSLYELCFFTADPGGFADQHYYNLAIRRIYNDITRVVPADQPWVANMATLVAIPTMSPEWSTGPETPNHGYKRNRNGDFVDNMKVEMPQLIEGQVCTPDGEPYAIIHQYDRYKVWEEEILKRHNLQPVAKAKDSLSFRNGWDKQIYEEVYVNNEYGVGTLKPEDVIVDIGAHVGFFSLLCADRGSANVWSFEANPRNYQQLCLNIEGYTGVNHFNKAVWRSDVEDTVVKVFLEEGEPNTGLSTAMTNQGVDVKTASLESILNKFDRVRLLKIDAEGSEHPILLTCNNLKKVEEIVGELHEYLTLEGLPEDAKLPGYQKYTRNELQQHLEKHGFSVTFTPVSWSETHALFRAVRC